MTIMKTEAQVRDEGNVEITAHGEENEVTRSIGDGMNTYDLPDLGDSVYITVDMNGSHCHSVEEVSIE